METPHVRKALASDLDEVHGWLVQQAREGREGALLQHWEYVQRAAEGTELLVFDDPARGGVVGCARKGLGCDLVSLDLVVEVKASCRRQGIGRALALHVLAQELERGQSLFLAACPLQSAVPFCRALDFETFDDAPMHDYVSMMVPVERDLPDDLPAAAVTLELYDNRRRLPDGGVALARFQPKAVQNPADGTVLLGERVQWFEGYAARRLVQEYVVRILVDGHQWYHGKTSYIGAAESGLQRNAAGCWLPASAHGILGPRRSHAHGTRTGELDLQPGRLIPCLGNLPGTHGRPWRQGDMFCWRGEQSWQRADAITGPSSE